MRRVSCLPTYENGVEVFNLGGEMGPELSVIKAGDRPSAGTAGQDGRPCTGCVIADRRDHANTGYDDALGIGTCQGNLLKQCFLYGRVA